MTFKELKAAVKGRFMNWGKYTAEKLENVSALFESTTTEDTGKVLTVGEDGSPVWGEGGGGLPPYTSADKGKVLTLREGGESETVTIVPEQTVTLAIPEGEGYPEPSILTNTYIAGLAVGQTGVLTVNGASDNITVRIFDGEFEIVSETLHCSVYSENGELFFATDDEGEYTLNLSVLAPSVEPKWEKADGIFPVQADTQTGALDKNYSEISAAANSGLLPVIFSTGISSPIFGRMSNAGNYSVYAAVPSAGTYVTLGIWTASSETGTLTPAT